jgi:ABC-2 type transport system permease protein
MTSPGCAARRPDSAERASWPPLAFAQQTHAIASVELRKLMRDPTDVLTRSVQPLLWLLVFGQVFGRLRAIPTGDVSYLEFLAPGVLAQSVLFSAIFYGIAIIWERDLGIVQMMLVSPAYRAALVLGKAAAAGIRGVIQTIIIYAAATAIGIHLSIAPASLVGVVAAVLLGSGVFATFSLLVACVVKTRERFMGIGQLMSMPLFFASNAIYPVQVMPAWLRAVAAVNPLTYLVDALRTSMLQPGGAGFRALAGDGGMLLLVLVVLVGATSRLYPTVVR